MLSLMLLLLLHVVFLGEFPTAVSLRPGEQTHYHWPLWEGCAKDSHDSRTSGWNKKIEKRQSYPPEV